MFSNQSLVLELALFSPIHLYLSSAADEEDISLAD